ncbi:uncharacterized protein LOC119542539 [Choloepus didactylus]|uniref:uncharacterized protein LOC119542539 n=1 Tax=Choloepus didactylus TaxID=27675 RepID=UPI00189DBBE4|nr:uncharacterized protein LOC119542539 [Choloepus didactylus]
MLLPLLGACALVGPFQGSEWEPVRGLISQDRSCRDLRCCGNLLILCLFLIWQVQHFWCLVTRTRPSMRKAIKVPSQKWTVSSMRRATFFRLAPESFISSGKLRGLDAHIQLWAQKQRWGYRRSLQESWARHLQSWQRRDQGPSWDVHNPSEPIFCTASFSHTCLLSQNSSWGARQVPWRLRGSQTNVICKPLLPAPETCQRVEQPLVHSQEELVPREPVVSVKSYPTSMTLASSLSNLPSTRRLQFCSGEFLPAPSNQQLEIPTWKSQGCLQEAWAPGRENQELSRGEDSRETQAPGLGNQRESRGDGARETQASGRQLPIDFGMEDDAGTEVLGWGNQSLIVSETDREIPPPGWQNQDHIGGENRTEIQELGREFLEGTEGREAEIQAHRRENQEQLRCKIDVETQTSECRNQDKSRGEDAVETQAFERKNKKEARGEDERKTQAQGLGVQDQTGGEDGAEIEAEERINKDQFGGEDAVQIQTPGREILGEVEEEAGLEIQALEWRKQAWVGSENVTEIQTPGWENHGQDGSEKTVEAQTFRGANQIQLRHEIQVGWGNQDLGRNEDARETQISRRKNLREIREEDWVVLQTSWWGNQSLVASEVDRELKIPYWGNQNQIGGEHGAEIQASERYQSEDGDEDGINTLAFEAENQRQLRGENDGKTHPPGWRNQDQLGGGNGADIQASGKRTLREVRGEDGKETQELREENQSQLRSGINGKIHTPKWKEQEHIQYKLGANTQALEAENWEILSKIGGGTHSAQWQVEEQIGGENGAENQAPMKRSQRETGGENGTEPWAPGEENQSQLWSDMDRKTHLSEWKNREQNGDESGTETQAPEKSKNREARGEDGVETQRPETEYQGQLESDIYGETHSLEKQTRGENSTGNQASEKRSQREVGREGGTKTQILGGEKPRLLRSKVNGKTCSLEWKSKKLVGGKDGAEIQIQGKKNPRGTGGADGIETQVSGAVYQGQLRSEIDEDIQPQGRGNQNKVEDEDAAAVKDVGSQRKHRAEDFGGPQVSRRANKNQVTGKDVAKAHLQVDPSGGEGATGKNLSLAWTPALPGFGYRAMKQKQGVAVNNSASALCLETRLLSHHSEVFLLASGGRKHLAGQGVAPARKYRVGVSPASQQARPGSQRGTRKDKVVHPGKASSLTCQLWNPQSLAAPLSQPSACHSVLCSSAPQAATALVDAPIALNFLPKWPALKKSKQLLLESLMRRKIAHLKWGLPQRILESYLLFTFLEPSSVVGVRLPGSYTSHELQGQQERHCEAKGSRPGIKPPEKPRRKSSKLPTDARVLEKCGPHGTEPLGSSTHPIKPRRSRPPGGTREPQVIQEEPPRAPLPAPRNPGPAAESKAGRPSGENSRGRKMVSPGVSLMAEMSPSGAGTSGSRAGHDHRRKECPPWEASKSPGRKFQQLTHWRRGSLEPLEGEGAGQWPPSCSIDSSSFKGSFHSAAVKLSMTLLNKMSWSPQMAKPQHSALNLGLQDPDPTQFPRVEDPHASEGGTGFSTSSLEKDLEPSGYCGAGAALPTTESPRDPRAPGNPKETPQSPPAPKKFGFMKRLKCFLQRGFRK